MKKFILPFCILILFGAFVFQGVKEQVKQDLSEEIAYPSPIPTSNPSVYSIPEEQITESLFVPYWALSDHLTTEEYQEYIYFGITPGNEGIHATESGAINVATFIAAVPEEKKSVLTLRMLDATQNSEILKDKARQKRLIASTLSFARENGFSGVVLDLEMSAIPFDSLVRQITMFTKAFAKETKSQKLSFSVTSYGDTFYRLRPFNMKEISESVDKVLIMAYDFHKARGNPGPNFPLQGQEIYGYDLTKMLDDYLNVMPAEKIQVVFGMFGYDWIVDEKGTGIEQGKPLTYHEIQQIFLSDCQYNSCVIKRKQDSAETNITYKDAEGKQHIVWFEDPESVAVKQKYLKKRGISSFGYWAYSYF